MARGSQPVDRMTANGPARLTSALLVRKGNATPASHGLGRQPISSLVQAAQVEKKMFAFFRSTPEKPAHRVEVTQAPRARQKPARRDARARLTLRVDADKYLRLRLVSAHRRRSLQHVLTEALDYYLEDIAPKVSEGKCACLESGRISEAPPGGCKLS
jgi:hypothetical protein